jgi:alpha-beta hydrolase superfamily lysophospholipase
VAEQQTPDTIVLIQGLRTTALSWERWGDRYSRRGYRVIARSLPGTEGAVEELLRDPSALERPGIDGIVDHYDAIVRGLERPPIIMGHSVGGLVTAILLDRGLGAAGVAIDAPAMGIHTLPFSTLESMRPAAHRPPLLLITAGDDHVAPAGLRASAHRAFPGRSDVTTGGPRSWEEVADYALSWAVENGTPTHSQGGQP